MDIEKKKYIATILTVIISLFALGVSIYTWHDTRKYSKQVDAYNLIVQCIPLIGKGDPEKTFAIGVLEDLKRNTVFNDVKEKIDLITTPSALAMITESQYYESEIPILIETLFDQDENKRKNAVVVLRETIKSNSIRNKDEIVELTLKNMFNRMTVPEVEDRFFVQGQTNCLYTFSKLSKNILEKHRETILCGLSGFLKSKYSDGTPFVLNSSMNKYLSTTEEILEVTRDQTKQYQCN